MSTPRARTGFTPDQRVLVLLAAGVAVCLFRLLADSPFLPMQKGQGRRSLQPAVYCWLTGEGRTPGLFRIDGALLADPLRAAAHGLDGLPLPVPPAGSRVAAFQLLDGALPEVAEPPPGLAPFFFAPIDINRADRELLMTLPGIGPRLADEIIKLRQKNRLNALPELLEVRGIGKAKLASLEGKISF